MRRFGLHIGMTVLLLFSLITAAYPQGDFQFRLSLAEESYRNGDFADAVDKYKAIADSGMVSADLYYNLGNSYFKIQDYKSAILYYERALRLSPNDDDIEYNLEYARGYITDRTQESSEFFLLKWFNSLSNLTSEKAWGIFNLLTLLLTLVFVGTFFFAKSGDFRKWGLSLGFVCLCLFLVSFAAGLVQRHDLQRTDEGIVFVPALMAKSSPDDAGTNIFVLHEGTKVNITDKVGQWCEIRVDGKVGWARISEIEII